jgi:CBS domain-containing protein
MQVKDVLAHKSGAVATIDPGRSIADAVAALAQHGVGALVVSSDGRTIQGIISERDVVRALNSLGPALLQTAVREIMTVNVHTCVPTDEVATLARTMTDKRFRHMPVTIDGGLYGIVSIGDLVKSRMDEMETEHDHLVDYISSAR